MASKALPTAVCLEVGTRRVFAVALDWPGWTRSGRDGEGALEALAAAAPRYAAVLAGCRVGFPAGVADRFDVVERVPGSATTDFGAPGEIAAADRRPLTAREASRIATILAGCWRAFDSVVAGAPAALRKGPRGGGRDRDAIVEHVLGAEVSYARKIGIRRSQPAAAERDAVDEFRTAVTTALAAARSGEPTSAKSWPARYAARRMAWHALDHAWEIEDRS